MKDCKVGTAHAGSNAHDEKSVRVVQLCSMIAPCVTILCDVLLLFPLFECKTIFFLKKQKILLKYWVGELSRTFSST